jgi:hypothetical protein
VLSFTIRGDQRLGRRFEKPWAKVQADHPPAGNEKTHLIKAASRDLT